MHLFEPVAHEFERFAEPFFEGSVQFLVNGGSHPLDLLRVIFLQLLQAQVDDSADIFKRSGQFFALRFRGAGTFLAITGHLFAQHPFATFMSALEQVNFGKQIAGGVLFAPGQKKENGD
jgi:hypothetical protein